MALPARIDTASGDIDGVNRDFQTLQDYVPGSAVVIRNGQTKRQDFTDGWTELGGKTIRLNEPPQIGDVIQIYYRPF